jgi:hypothetical protein
VSPARCLPRRGFSCLDGRSKVLAFRGFLRKIGNMTRWIASRAGCPFAGSPPMLPSNLLSLPPERPIPPFPRPAGNSDDALPSSHSAGSHQMKSNRLPDVRPRLLIPILLTAVLQAQQPTPPPPPDSGGGGNNGIPGGNLDFSNIPWQAPETPAQPAGVAVQAVAERFPEAKAFEPPVN